MPSECRMPSIFGPTPEISFRSSTAVRLLDAGRAVRIGQRRLGAARPLPPAGWLRDAGRHAGQRLFAQLLVNRFCGLFALRRVARAADAGGASAAGATLTGDGDFTAALVSGASVFGLAGIGRRRRGAARRLRRRRRPAPPRASALASLSRVDFSTAFSSLQRRQARLRRRDDAVDLRSAGTLAPLPASNASMISASRSGVRSS